MCSTKSNLSQHPKKSESHVRKTVIRKKKKKNHSHHHHQRQRKKFLIMSPATSTRWCPTAEQLMILEEMYKGGIRTPNASQIQQITAHLSFYGKIEGKNVFYWFQNHKARDRQKLRRKLTRQQQQHHHHHLILHPHHINYQTSGASSSSSPSAAGLQQFPPPPPPQYNSPNQFLLPQEGVLLQEEPPSHQVMNYTSWKVDNISQNKEDMEKATRMMYGCDWMMMMDMVPPNFPYSTTATTTTTTTRPVLKTLELFPVKSTNLKDECTTSKHFSCSTNSSTK